MEYLLLLKNQVQYIQHPAAQKAGMLLVGILIISVVTHSLKFIIQRNIKSHTARYKL